MRSRMMLPMLIALLLAPVGIAQAQTVTTKDIVELSKAGLAEDVLLALIEVHRPVFPVDSATLKGLKDAGVAPNVIVAMIKSGRELPVAPPLEVTDDGTAESAPTPQVIFVETPRHDEPAPRVRYEERVREVAVPVPIYVPVRARPIHRPEPKSEPVYWGFGGKLRPDAWKTAADVQRDARVPREPQKK